jgi:hypothetical protein
MPAGIAADDDVAPAGQRPADRLPRLSPHQHRSAHRQPLEARQIAREVHQQCSVAADPAVAGDGSDEADGRPVHAGLSPGADR